MICVNLMMHGAIGEVVWGDSLDEDSFFDGWAINPNIQRLKGIPNIEKINKEQSFIYNNSQRKKNERLKIQKEKDEEVMKGKLNKKILELPEDKKLIFPTIKKKQILISFSFDSTLRYFRVLFLFLQVKLYLFYSI